MIFGLYTSRTDACRPLRHVARLRDSHWPAPIWQLARAARDCLEVRHELKLDAVPMGPSPHPKHTMILDIHNGVSPSGFGHPTCKGGQPAEPIIKGLSRRFPAGPKS